MTACRPTPTLAAEGVLLAWLVLAGLAILMTAGLPAAAQARSALGSGLHDRLLAVEGRFVWDAERQDYVVSDRPALAGLLGPSSEASLPALVDCIDDPRPARATLDARSVSLGVVCYQALRLVAYVEQADWPGHVGPTATPAERSAAKRAWQTAFAEGRYILH
ncbi:MAG: hypothetical protein ACFCUT_20000 [Kiloniellaceae bacterium]